MTEEYAELGGLFAQRVSVSIIEHKERSVSAQEGKRKRVLQRLNGGPVSCESMESDPHRGQAVVRTLRQSGHIIDTKLIEGVLHYVYQCYVRRQQVTPAMQEAYYQTPHWKQKARERKDLDGWRCRQCNSETELESHHWRYNLFAESVLHDLCTYCKKCHTAIHDAAKGSQDIHFPRTVPEIIAVKLGWKS